MNPLLLEELCKTENGLKDIDNPFLDEPKSPKINEEIKNDNDKWFSILDGNNLEDMLNQEIANDLIKEKEEKLKK